ncbi:GNAT family N-acetyltransferase [Pontibacter sp. BT310]|uniref:GNAT family N-acetyltransferase n=1 Tax=Pontibacter populi TaxID=890055 RepID=A0ABS6X9E5_9BACT|nr:GNAT family N-acetyltransferase [Pontibacter populi]MBJ6117765.1 GNAT family N-acetyltransferase [Pontibacter sp. BT310]MBR0570191.1 GNAT family N-acetyltransferase [Microvirga sp. STS03]MBW3364617.1 GNAT family N-acetyltransferase [Pontibacter populi]
MIQIRKGTIEDLPQVLQLIQELAEYEKAPNEVTNTLEDMQRDGFGERPIFEFFVAEDQEAIVGIALYYTAYSTWKGRTIYLEDLVVTERLRRSGIGKKLFDVVAEEAKRLGAKRFRWQVLEWNEPAITFYKKIGADLDGEWMNCTMTEQQIQDYNA